MNQPHAERKEDCSSIRVGTIHHSQAVKPESCSKPHKMSCCARHSFILGFFSLNFFLHQK